MIRFLDRTFNSALDERELAILAGLYLGGLVSWLLARWPADSRAAEMLWRSLP